MWNLELRALGSGDILIERSEATLLDAAGVVAGRAEEYWSRSAGCSVCSTEVRVAENRTMNWSNRWIRYTRGGVPVAFVYTLWYVDDLGPGTTTVTVPVR